MDSPGTGRHPASDAEWKPFRRRQASVVGRNPCGNAKTFHTQNPSVANAMAADSLGRLDTQAPQPERHKPGRRSCTDSGTHFSVGTSGVWRLWAVPEKDRSMESRGKHADSTTLHSSAACGHGPVPGAGCGSASFAVTFAGRESLARLRSSGSDNRASAVPTQITKPSSPIKPKSFGSPDVPSCR